MSSCASAARVRYAIIVRKLKTPMNPAPFDVASIRGDFPILRQQIHGRPLVYLDNASTTQKPQVVIDRLTRFYVEENANVHGGVHQLSERATEAFEAARGAVGRFFNAADPTE